MQHPTAVWAFLLAKAFQRLSIPLRFMTEHVLQLDSAATDDDVAKVGAEPEACDNEPRNQDTAARCHAARYLRSVARYLIKAARYVRDAARYLRNAALLRGCSGDLRLASLATFTFS